MPEKLPPMTRILHCFLKHFSMPGLAVMVINYGAKEDWLIVFFAVFSALYIAIMIVRHEDEAEKANVNRKVLTK